MKTQKLSEQSNQTLLLNKKLLSGVLIVTPILIIAACIIYYFSGYGIMIILSLVLIPNAIFSYYMLSKFNKELKSRGLL